jgi:hypothetical protein
VLAMKNFAKLELPDCEIANLSNFVCRIEEEVASARKSASSKKNADQKLTANSMAAALIIVAARLVSSTNQFDPKEELQRAFVSGAAEAFSLITKEHGLMH